MFSILHWHRNGGGGDWRARPRTQKNWGPAPYLAPHFLWFTSLGLALSISIYQLPYLRQHCLGLGMVRGHFRVLENEKFSTSCERETPPTPTPTRSLCSLVCLPPPPHFQICCYGYAYVLLSVLMLKYT